MTNYRIGWVIHGRVFMIQPAGDLNLETIRVISNTAVELVRTGNAPVHLIADTRRIQNFPKSMGGVRKVLGIMREPGLSSIFALTNNYFINLIASTIASINSVRYTSYHNEQSLLIALKNFDPSLPQLPSKLDMQEDLLIS